MHTERKDVRSFLAPIELFFPPPPMQSRCGSFIGWTCAILVAAFNANLGVEAALAPEVSASKEAERMREKSVRMLRNLLLCLHTNE